MNPKPDFNQEGPPLCVLVVADSLALRRLVRRRLAEVAREIAECAALAAYGQVRPDWVLRLRIVPFPLQGEL